MLVESSTAVGKGAQFCEDSIEGLGGDGVWEVAEEGEAEGWVIVKDVWGREDWELMTLIETHYGYMRMNLA